MADADTLDILVLLDRSGSMQDVKADHEGGLKSFIEDQRDMAGDVRLTLIQFDTSNPCEVVYDRTPLADVKEIRLIPRGGTPLLDAIGKGVSHLRAQIKDTDHVVVMVITDGEENSSREWTKDRVKALTTEMEKAGWNFLFLGANMDAFSEAATIGVSAKTTMSYANTSGSVGALYAVNSAKMATSRNLRASGASAFAVTDSFTYTSAERQAVADGTFGDINGTFADKTNTFTVPTAGSGTPLVTDTEKEQ